MRHDRVLFYRQNRAAQLCSLSDVLKEAVDALDEHRLRTASSSDLAEELIHKHGLAVPVLHPERTTHDEAEVELRKHVQTMSLRARPPVLKAADYRFYVPFTGYGGFFYTQPTAYDVNPSRAEVREAEIVIHITSSTQPPRAFAIREEFETALARIEANLESLRNDMIGLKAMLCEVVQVRMEIRRSRFKSVPSIADQIGFPRRVA